MWLNLSAFNYGKELKKICTSESHEQTYDTCFKVSVKHTEINCEEYRFTMYGMVFSDCDKNEIFCDIWATTQAALCKEICELQRGGRSYKESRLKIYPSCMALWAYWLPKAVQSL